MPYKDGGGWRGTYEFGERCVKPKDSRRLSRKQQERRILEKGRGGWKRTGEAGGEQRKMTKSKKAGETWRILEKTVDVEEGRRKPEEAGYRRFDGCHPSKMGIHICELVA